MNLLSHVWHCFLVWFLQKPPGLMELPCHMCDESHKPMISTISGYVYFLKNIQLLYLSPKIHQESQCFIVHFVQLLRTTS